MSRGLLVLLAVLMAAIFVPAQPAAADGPCGFDCNINSDDAANAYTGALFIPADGFSGDGGIRAQAATCPGCVWQLSPLCLGAAPGEATGACAGAVTVCVPDGVRYAIYLLTPGSAGFRFVGSFCYRPGQPLTLVALTPLVRDAFLKLLPPQAPTYQPPGGTLVNLPATFDSGQRRRFGPVTVPLAGFTIGLTGEAGWSWDFGDGSPPLQTAEPGGPYPDMSVSHTFRRQGGATVVLTTTWTGTFTVDGSGPYPIDGPDVTQVAAPLAVPVVGSRAELLAPD